ncbi:MAG: BrnT family toxin [FCB group bacterium]|jgi:uncharacterized DUF497 family protein
MLIFDCTGFDWDESNFLKNWKKHKVSQAECEEIFFNENFLVKDDEIHSIEEKRYYALGSTAEGRELFTVFTVRENKIRIISARDMSKKERTIYYEQIKKASSF